MLSSFKYNYSFSKVFVEDVLVFRGSLLKSPSRADLANKLPFSYDNEYSDNDKNLSWGTIDNLNLSQSILFTNDETVVEKEASRVPLPENDLCFINDGLVKEESLSINHRKNLVRPTTASYHH